MLKKRRSHFYLQSLLIAFPLLVLLSIFIEIPNSIPVYAEIFPKEKWLLSRGSNGEVISTHIDYLKGRNKSYSITNFERGEFLNIIFTDSVLNSSTIRQGDTIAFIKSNKLEEELLAANSDLDVALANLKSENSPAKEALLEEARYKLAYSEKKIQEQHIIYDRVRQLFEKGFSSQQEFDLNKNLLDLLKIEYRINEANLKSLTTGIKPEEIAALESQIKSIRKMSDYLENKKLQFTLTAPFSGTILPTYRTDTLFQLTNKQDVILQIPMELSVIKKIKSGGLQLLEFPDFKKRVDGTIASVGSEVKILDGKQIVFVTVLVSQQDDFLIPGMILRCNILSGDVTVAGYILEMLNR